MKLEGKKKYSVRFLNIGILGVFGSFGQNLEYFGQNLEFFKSFLIKCIKKKSFFLETNLYRSC